MLGTFDNWYEIARRTLALEGVDLGAELAMRGIARNRLNAGRVPKTLAREVWAVVDDRSEDPAFGLSMVRGIDFAEFDELGVALVASGSLEMMLNHIVDYHQLLTGSLRLELEEEPNGIGISLTDNGAVHWRAHEFSAGVLVRVVRARFGKAVAPLSLHLAYSNDAARDAYSRYFRCPVIPGSDRTTLMFDAGAGEQSSRPSQLRVAARLEGLLQAELQALTDKLPLSSIVQSEISGSLNQGTATLDEVARELNMSGRTLQRRLAEEGMSFSDVVEAARRELAKEWVAHGELSITEIAYLLGFGSSSAFGRAYKRWFGLAPTTVRSGRLAV